MDKKCTYCYTIKDFKEFHRNPCTLDKLQSQCKACCSVKTKVYRSTHKIAHNNYIRTAPRAKFNAYKAGAKQRKLPFSLSFTEFLAFWQNPCYYCKDAIAVIGIDRINNTLGYSLNNIVPCCRICNRMKLKMTQKAFITHCEKIVRSY